MRAVEGSSDEVNDWVLVRCICAAVLLQSVPDLIENSLCNVNKIKRLKSFTNAAPHIFRMEKNRFGSCVGAHPSHWHCEKPSKIESQAIRSIRKMLSAALVNDLSLLILFTLHREFSIKSGTDCSFLPFCSKELD